jgi:tetratricopeptide (TPR) repeat protein
VLLAPAPLVAQFEDPPSPGEEPSSEDTLFEQSDLGNVTQAAQFAYRGGQRELDAAAKLADKAADAPSEEKRQALLEKRTKALQQAVEKFQEAIGYQPDLLDAYTGLGAALRELGQYGDALQVHARALEADSDREEDFRGWAGSLLALDMLGDATTAYTRLATSRPDQAAILMETMKAWLAEKQADPGDLSPEDVQRLADWIAQHEAG